MTEYYIGQSVRFRATFSRYATAGGERVGKLYPISDELPDSLADAVERGAPMQVTVDGYDHDEMEDTDVVIVTVRHEGRVIPGLWVIPECIAPV